MSGYRHGIYISEVPTSIVPPVKAENSMPIFFVTAPLHLTQDPYSVTNEPKLCYTYEEAVKLFGFSMKNEIWNNYTVCQVIYSQFVLYGVAPMVIVNVLDPKIHKRSVVNEEHIFKDYTYVLNKDGVLIDTLKIKKDGIAYKLDEHYTLNFNADGFIVINVNKNTPNGINPDDNLTLSYDVLAPDMVDSYDIIGGYDNIDGKNKGLELVNEIYPRFRIIPAQIVAPKFSCDPAVAAVMDSKATNINGHFRCISINDLPTVIKKEIEVVASYEDNLSDVESEEIGQIKVDSDISYEHLKYTDISGWKNKNNYVSENQINCYPMLRLGEQLFFYSVQMAGLICRTDYENEDIPYNSPSNKNLKINGLAYEDGEEIVLTNEQGNYLNGNGIVTAINFTNGWVAWGNRTGIYPSSSDVKDALIPIRRMFNWIGNTIVLTYWSKIDYPLTRRTVESILDSINIWFNALSARGFILGGRVEFLATENLTTDLLDGIAKFHVYVTPPPPLREANFILEYDVDYLQKLFG